MADKKTDSNDNGGLDDPYQTVIRLQMIKMIRNKNRVSEFSVKRPTKWNFKAITNPVSGMPFTPNGAWHYVLEKLEEGAPLKKIALDKPEGKFAYTMNIIMENGEELYVKLELGSGVVFGRSFHYSNF